MATVTAALMPSPASENHRTITTPTSACAAAPAARPASTASASGKPRSYNVTMAIAPYRVSTAFPLRGWQCDEVGGRHGPLAVLQLDHLGSLVRRVRVALAEHERRADHRIGDRLHVAQRRVHRILG